MRLTVFTPAYNRGYIIGKLYESLKQQTFKDFEWVIVDDGSTDNTEEIIAGFQKEKGFFPIRYFKTKNGGKHRAINRGVLHASGELFFIVDSDDYLPSDSLEIINEIESTIPIEEKDKFAGVCGEKFYQNGTAVGKSSLSGLYTDATTIDRQKYGIVGDKAEVYYTKVLKLFPFPEFDGEKFCTESLVWDKISNHGYKLRFFNKNIYICEYLDDGLTAQGLKLYAKNPRQWGLSIEQDHKFGKTSNYGKSLEIYKYYVLLKSELPLSKIKQYLNISWLSLYSVILFHGLTDLCRSLSHRTTIKDSIRK